MQRLILAAACLVGCAGKEAADPTSGGSSSSSPTSSSTSGESGGSGEAELGSSTTGDGDDPAVIAYCDCVFDRCHDAYHDKWGEDEFIARTGCEDEAAALADEALQCRTERCTMVEADAQCPPALGDPAC